MHCYNLRQSALRTKLADHRNGNYSDQAQTCSHVLFLTFTNFFSSPVFVLFEVLIQIFARFLYCSFKTTIFFLDILFFLILLNEILTEPLQHLIYFIRFLHFSYLIYTLYRFQRKSLCTTI